MKACGTAAVPLKTMFKAGVELFDYSERVGRMVGLEYCNKISQFTD